MTIICLNSSAYIATLQTEVFTEIQGVIDPNVMYVVLVVGLLLSYGSLVFHILNDVNDLLLRSILD